jgi:hypothetical protein
MMAIGHVSYRKWLFRLLAWDGLLPACIAFAPIAVELIHPHNRGAIEITSVTLPVAAFLLRVRAGKRHIDSNQCSGLVRCFQFCALGLAIVPLILIDCFIILSHLMPKGAPFARNEWLVWPILLGFYLTLMAVAMYPGRTPPPALQWDDAGTHPDWWEAEDPWRR